MMYLFLYFFFFYLIQLHFSQKGLSYGSKTLNVALNYEREKILALSKNPLTPQYTTFGGVHILPDQTFHSTDVFGSCLYMALQIFVLTISTCINGGKSESTHMRSEDPYGASGNF